VNVSKLKQDVIDAAKTEREVTFTTYGRKTGNPSDVTIFVVTDGKRLFILSGQGMARQWPQNLVARGEGVLHFGGLDVKVKARHVTDPAETRTVAELYGGKYGPSFGSPKPGDPPRLSEQATFELIPAGS
jgi:deazaflavin-dependent oxidoreductase (nitroreductase family)